MSEKCNVDQDGTCAFHGQIEERREAEKTLINHIPKLLTMVNRLLGTTLLIILMMGGSFTYTTLSNGRTDSTVAELRTSDNHLRSEIQKVVKSVADLTTAVAVDQVKHNSMMEGLTTLNGTLQELLKVNGVTTP